MAALLALRDHQIQSNEAGDAAVSQLLGERMAKAQQLLQQWLGEWDVASAMRIGFEILVPALLESLERDAAVKFDFPGRDHLMSLNKKKFDKFRPEMLYAS